MRVFQRRTSTSGWVAEAALASLTSGFVLAWYLRTLAPGLLALRDTPAFQYVGRILGVPHQPGYPLYVLITHLFSFFPVGSLAFRMNLFSALAGAVAAGMLYVVMRQTGTVRAMAAAGAAAFALGPLVWSQSIIAEVYSLESALIAGAMAALLHWRRRPSVRRAAASWFLWGLVFGHHTSDLLFLPGVLAFIWLTDRTWLTRPHRLATAIAILTLASAPYLLVILRTAQGAAYVLEPAHGVADLVRIAAGAGYRDNLFPFTLANLYAVRLPLAWSVVQGDVPWPLLALAGWGVFTIAQRDKPMVAFLLVGVTAQLVFVLNYDIPDIAVFFIPVLLLLWVSVAAGASALYTRLPRSAPARIAAIVVVLALPAWSGWHHAPLVDQSWNTGIASYMRSWVEVLPPRSVVLGENWVADQLIRYKVLGEGLPGGKTVRGPVGAVDTHLWTDQPDPVFAFAQTAARQRVRGYRFVRQWVRVRLAEWVEAQHPGTVIVIAASASSSAETTAGDLGLRFVGATGRRRGSWSPLVTVGRRGGNGAFVSTNAPSAEAAARVGVAPASVSIVAHADERSAAVTVHGWTLVSQDDGAVAAAWTPDGRLLGVHAAGRAAGLPVVDDTLQLFHEAGPRLCEDVGPGEQRSAPRLSHTAMLAIEMPPGARIELQARTVGRPFVRLVDNEPGVALRIYEYTSPTDAGHTLTVEQTGAEAGWALLAVGSRMDALTVSMAASSRPARARVCAVPLDMSLRPDGSAWVLGMANDTQQYALGPGWSARAETSAWGPVRRMADRTASVVVDVPDAPGWRVTLSASADVPAPGGRIGLRLADGEVQWQSARTGWCDYEWHTRDVTAMRRGHLSITAEVADGSWLPLVVRRLTFTPE